MTQNDMIGAIAADANITRAQAGIALATVVGSVTKSLKAGNPVRLSGVGTFSVKPTQERTARNPKTGEAIKIKASKKVRFSPAKDLKEGVAG